ncbi:MAG TPA: poly-beta-1,6-N-acetyl-D-glucosamine N-deacetylase PgaB [Syntrophales bacterium]|nr:poly-beta-1,6-N-acetyl-D-glucosamine N-deacetylase PgaB [Syntrophales bacterium]
MTAPAPAADTFITLVYHDIPEAPVAKDDVSQKDFVNQIEYLRTHGYTFVSAADVLSVSKGQSTLPEKAVLLTFDDAYVSFHRFVFPILRLYNAPAVLSVVTSWIDRPETSGYVGKQLMNWQQIREVSDSGLIAIASHSDALHRLAQANAEGNIEPSPATFFYFPDRKRYETREEFRIRLRADLAKSIDVLAEKLGKKPNILTWPYGRYNLIGVEEAKKLGFEMILTLDEGYSSIGALDRIPRHYLEAELDWLKVFKDSLKHGLREDYRMRAVQVDLDLIVKKGDYEESDRNLGRLIDRLVALGVNTVFLQGFCDISGTGNVKSLYFMNSTLPVEMDFLGHAANRIRSREIKVFVWMPALAYELPDTVLNEELKVRELKGGKPAVTSSWYRRLSPFDSRSLEAARAIFRDLSAYVAFDGILIQDDAYLAETEDFHPAALEAFRKQYGVAPDPQQLRKNKELEARWTAFKTEALDHHVEEIVKTVRTYRPTAAIARNIYSEAVTNPESKRWFAQDVLRYLQAYDYTVVMAYAAMEDRKDSKAWYRELYRAAGGRESSRRIVFKLQSYDWKSKRWINSRLLQDEMTAVLALGAHHIAYYPDNVYLNQPELDTIAAILSSKSDAVRKQPVPSGPQKKAFFDQMKTLIKDNP